MKKLWEIFLVPFNGYGRYVELRWWAHARIKLAARARCFCVPAFIWLFCFLVGCAAPALAREAESYICPYLGPDAPRSENTVRVRVDIENEIEPGQRRAELGNSKNLQYSVAADLACYLGATTMIVDDDDDIHVRIIGKSGSDTHLAVDPSKKMEVKLVSSRIPFDPMTINDYRERLEMGCFASRFAYLYWLPKLWGDPRAAAAKMASTRPALLAYGEIVGVSCMQPVPTLSVQNSRKVGGREYTFFSDCEALASPSLAKYLKDFNLAMVELKPSVFESCRPQ
ncbi:MAG: hypothetical protein ABL907_11720 [Hyphomicrobium sp.]